MNSPLLHWYFKNSVLVYCVLCNVYFVLTKHAHMSYISKYERCTLQ